MQNFFWVLFNFTKKIDITIKVKKNIYAILKKKTNNCLFKIKNIVAYFKHFTFKNIQSQIYILLRMHDFLSYLIYHASNIYFYAERNNLT